MHINNQVERKFQSYINTATTLQRHATHGPRTGIPYYNLTTPDWEGTPPSLIRQIC